MAKQPESQWRIEAARRAVERAMAEWLEVTRNESGLRVSVGKAEAERLVSGDAARIEADRVAAERMALERAEAERLEAARLGQSPLETARLEAELAEAERLAPAEVEADRIAAPNLSLIAVMVESVNFKLNLRASELKQQLKTLKYIVLVSSLLNIMVICYILAAYFE